jgi:hypothetical protein
VTSLCRESLRLPSVRCSCCLYDYCRYSPTNFCRIQRIATRRTAESGAPQVLDQAYSLPRTAALAAQLLAARSTVCFAAGVLHQPSRLVRYERVNVIRIGGAGFSFENVRTWLT